MFFSLPAARLAKLNVCPQFFHRRKQTKIASSPLNLSKKEPMAFFRVAEPEELTGAGDSLSESAPVILDNTFYAASENGFTVARGGENGEVPWSCQVPACIASLQV